ncbi:MAG: hypothetical protein GY913_10940 [Proteobacteria bacterium]|nr:hypothetical protein [Pseudomonadota bacterium]MCP4917429.1 hypothetical protein [Pseudomonadota bacterium]
MTWLTISTAFAGGWNLVDVGADVPGTQAIIVATPGVPGEAYLPWVDVFEQGGLNAWLLELPPRDQSVEQAVTELDAALSHIEGDWVVAAHGYAGVLLLLAEPHAARMALVGTPLAAHVATPRLRDPGSVVSEGLPFDPALLGDLPGEPYSGHLGTAYAVWATDFPDYRAPQIPTLVVGSNIDPVAPPEITRLPSLDWTAREWHRAGMLGVAEEDLSHAELLSHPRTARMVGRFLADE